MSDAPSGGAHAFPSGVTISRDIFDHIRWANEAAPGMRAELPRMTTPTESITNDGFSSSGVKDAFRVCW